MINLELISSEKAAVRETDTCSDGPCLPEHQSQQPEKKKITIKI